MIKTYFFKNLVILVSILFLNLSYSSYSSAKEPSFKMIKMKKTVTNYYGILFLKQDGTAIVNYNDNLSHAKNFIKVDENSLKDIDDVYTSHDVFVALKKDGTVITWGDKEFGADPEYSNKFLNPINEELEHIKSITVSYLVNVFAALKDNGDVIVWGDRKSGGDPEYSDKDTAKANGTLANITSIASTANGAFAALRDDGIVISWGKRLTGGDPEYLDGEDVAYKNEDLIDIVDVVASDYGAFAALKKDGTVISWGSLMFGGNPNYSDKYVLGISREMKHIVKIYSNEGAFIAFTKEGSRFSWGNKKYVEELLKQYGNSWF